MQQRNSMQLTTNPVFLFWFCFSPFPFLSVRFVCWSFFKKFDPNSDQTKTRTAYYGGRNCTTLRCLHHSNKFGKRRLHCQIRLAFSQDFINDDSVQLSASSDNKQTRLHFTFEFPQSLFQWTNHNPAIALEHVLLDDITRWLPIVALRKTTGARLLRRTLKMHQITNRKLDKFQGDSFLTLIFRMVASQFFTLIGVWSVPASSQFALLHNIQNCIPISSGALCKFLNPKRLATDSNDPGVLHQGRPRLLF